MNEPKSIEVFEAYFRSVSAKPDKDGILVCGVTFSFDVKPGDEATIGGLARLLRRQVQITVETPQLSFDDALAGAIADAGAALRADGITSIEVNGRRVPVGPGGEILEP